MMRPAPVLTATRAAGADPGLPLPDYQSAGAAGADLRADTGGATVTLAPGARALIATGLHVAVPDGHEMQIRPRSGLALHHGVTVANAPGTVDADYRGPLGVILVNLGDVPFDVTHGMRIAQAVISPVIRVRWRQTETLPDTARGSEGFGSTGLEMTGAEMTASEKAGGGMAAIAVRATDAATGADRAVARPTDTDAQDPAARTPTRGGGTGA